MEKEEKGTMEFATDPEQKMLQAAAETFLLTCIAALPKMKELSFIKSAVTFSDGGIYLVQIQHVIGPKRKGIYTEQRGRE